MQDTQLLLLLLLSLALLMWVMRAMHPSGLLEQGGLWGVTPACCQHLGEGGLAYSTHVWSLLLPVLVVVPAVAVLLLLVGLLLGHLRELLFKLQDWMWRLPLQQHLWCLSPPQLQSERQLVHPCQSPPKSLQQQQEEQQPQQLSLQLSLQR
jgi:hypothetical protein